MDVLKERRRSGKRPFRTFHKSAREEFDDFDEYDEIDNDTLTIFESWATETFVRQQQDGLFMSREEAIEDVVERTETKMDDLATMLQMKQVIELVKKLESKQEEISEQLGKILKTSVIFVGTV